MTTKREELRARLAGNERELLDELLRELDADRHHQFALFDEAPMFLVYLEGPELRVTQVNRRVRELTDPTYLLGKTAREILRKNDDSVAALERVFATGVSETIYGIPPNFRLEEHERRFFTRTFVAVRRADGSIRGVLSMSHEVTDAFRERIAREESEQRSRAEMQRIIALFDEAPLFLGVIEAPDWTITTANRNLRESLGGVNIVGTRLRDLTRPDNPTIATIERVYESGRRETAEIVARIPAIEGRTFHVTFAPTREPDGTGRVLVAGVETTEQRKARESLEQHAQELEAARRESVEAARAKDHFLAMLGHELRNPLAPMLTAVQVMGLEGTSSPALGLLERQIQHLTHLVDDLLDISRIARGMIVLNRQTVESVTFVGRALEIAGPLIEQRGHRVVTDLVHRDLGVNVDPDRLAQVVANLITNAAKYSDPESQIRIVGKRNGDRVVLTVSDDGIGIAPDMLERVFEPFVQQPQTHERSYGGLGLGLSIVKSLVTAHGGSVSAHSDGPGRGSTFTIELPFVDARKTPPGGHRAVQTSRSGSGSRPAMMPARILVVDDNFEAADILQIGLSALGHSIAVAYDGPSALEIATTHAPQIALVDLGLPVMDGYRLAELLRTTHGIPVVAITGYGQESDRQRTREAGFAAHLVKPVDLHELADLVSRLCARASST